MPRTRQIQLRIYTDLEDALDQRLSVLNQEGDPVSRNEWINRVIRRQLAQPVMTLQTEKEERI